MHGTDVFGAAVVCVRAMTATGGVLSVAGGTLVTLGNVAPWLFAGTALATIIALARASVVSFAGCARRCAARGTADKGNMADIAGLTDMC